MRFLEHQFDELCRSAFPKDISAEQKRHMRWCFMAGAHAIVNKLPTILDPGDMETGRDMQIMDAIHKELEECQTEIVAACKTVGTA